MSLGFRIVLLGCVTALTLGLTTPAGAAAPATTELSVTATSARAGTLAEVTVRLVTRGGEPVAGAVVRLQRGEKPAGRVTTGDDGTASTRVRTSRTPAENRLTATFAGDATYAGSTAKARIDLTKRSSRLRLSAPRSVVDERRVTLSVAWRTGGGQPVAGPVRLFRKVGKQRWKPAATLRTGRQGDAELTVRPRQDTWWQARAAALPWVHGARSGVRRIDNLPPGLPVHLPQAAPRPRRALPPQPHAVGAGPNLAIGRIPDGIWGQMTGISWHQGCPVGRAGLRLVRVNYWDYSGYRRRGELVAAAGAAGPMGAALAEMYRRKLPIRAMYRVDRFGWGQASHGGNDYASMAAGNTSAFNCRDVTGRPGRRSPHSWGRSLDVNTWENPYRSAQGIVPNRWWQSRSHPRVAWRSRTHAVVQVMARHGLRWTYGLSDTQHFDYVGSPARAATAPKPCRRFCD